MWERYDVIMMPKAFAYGGMENPRLTFLSPTLVVGDKSLTDVVAHEIAHSWFGNLVTNASWGQFFLNEGFTMYAQRRITDAVHGEAFTALEALVSWQLLDQEVKDQGGKGPFTKLLVPIPHDVDPDDTYNDVRVLQHAPAQHTAMPHSSDTAHSVCVCVCVPPLLYTGALREGLRLLNVATRVRPG